MRLQNLTFVIAILAAGCSSKTERQSTTGGERNVVCEAGDSSGDVQAPEFVKNLSGQTSWFAAPLVVDLDGDGSNELIAAYYDLFVFDAQMNELARIEDGDGRVFAGHVVADLEGDGTTEIVYARGSQVWAVEWRDGAASVKDGWPADTTTADNPPEVRGMAAADLDGDGTIEIVATTTQTERTENGGAQVFVFDANGDLYQPAGGHSPAWPRYNALTGEGNDLDRNGHVSFNELIAADAPSFGFLRGY